MLKIYFILLLICYISASWRPQIASAFRNFKVPVGSYAEKWQALMVYGQGVASEIRERLCMVEPCMNKGTCVKKADKPLGFACTCPVNFRGPLCEYSKCMYYFIRVHWLIAEWHASCIVFKGFSWLDHLTPSLHRSLLKPEGDYHSDLSLLNSGLLILILWHVVECIVFVFN